MVAKWKRCTRCGQLKNADDFQKQPDSIGSSSLLCTKCRAIVIGKSTRTLYRTYDELVMRGEERTTEMIGSAARRIGV